MMLNRDPDGNDAEARRKLRGLLTLPRVDGEPAGRCPTFALIYPQPGAGRLLGDPLAIARDLGAAQEQLSQDDLLRG
ncbi:MAG: hypothetical protein IPG72_16265 [Ardenticatenales bacterium]|nr:hypothetical protein [Ardenticatenales bacterium]